MRVIFKSRTFSLDLKCLVVRFCVNLEQKLRKRLQGFQAADLAGRLQDVLKDVVVLQLGWLDVSAGLAKLVGRMEVAVQGSRMSTLGWLRLEGGLLRRC